MSSISHKLVTLVLFQVKKMREEKPTKQNASLYKPVDFIILAALSERVDRD